MVADPSELCGTAGDLLISELAGVQIAIIHRSDKTVIKSVRCTIREMIKEMTNFISITDIHTLQIEQTWLLCNLPSDEHITNFLYHSLCTKHGNLQ